MKNLPLLLLALILVSCQTTRNRSEDRADATAELRGLLVGAFDSADQAASDSSYYDISLKMYPIWTDRPGDYLYVEQAVSAMPDKPYRQRVYELRHLGGKNYASVVYALSNEDEAVGKWADPEWFDDYDTGILEEREGCTVFMTRVSENEYLGATRASDCKSSLRGASYATSQVVVTPTQVASWDQGFDDQDQQVWGATEGGYLFIRRE